MPAATLRSWEDRHGFPRPLRRAGGHRRYQDGDVALIGEVLRLRTSGMSLQAAIGQAVAREMAAEPSVFAALRRRHPGLAPQELSKATILALTRAIEDECCAQAGQAALFAGFQQERFYRNSQDRWEELARTARVVVVFADFGASSAADASPARVYLPRRGAPAPGERSGDPAAPGQEASRPPARRTPREVRNEGPSGHPPRDEPVNPHVTAPARSALSPAFPHAIARNRRAPPRSRAYHNKRSVINSIRIASAAHGRAGPRASGRGRAGRHQGRPARPARREGNRMPAIISRPPSAAPPPSRFVPWPPGSPPSRCATWLST